MVRNNRMNKREYQHWNGANYNVIREYKERIAFEWAAAVVREVLRDMPSATIEDLGKQLEWQGANLERIKNECCYKLAPMGYAEVEAVLDGIEAMERNK